MSKELEALERTIERDQPKQVLTTPTHFYCPNCIDIVGRSCNYCKNCGQRLSRKGVNKT